MEQRSFLCKHDVLDYSRLAMRFWAERWDFHCLELVRDHRVPSTVGFIKSGYLQAREMDHFH